MCSACKSWHIGPHKMHVHRSNHGWAMTSEARALIGASSGKPHASNSSVLFRIAVNISPTYYFSRIKYCVLPLVARSHGSSYRRRTRSQCGRTGTTVCQLFPVHRKYYQRAKSRRQSRRTNSFSVYGEWLFHLLGNLYGNTDTGRLLSVGITA